MKNTAALAVTAVAGLLGPAVVSTAQAAATPCAASAPKAVQIVPPTNIIFGRETVIPMTTDFAISHGDWALVGGPLFGDVQFEATSADPADPISHPFTRNVAPTVYGYEDDADLPTLLLEPGDGPAQLSATWEQYQFLSAYNQPRCTASTSVVVSGGASGDPPRRVKAESQLKTSVDRNRSPQYYRWWEEWIEFQVDPAKPSDAAIGPVTVQVKGAGKTRTMSLPDQADSRWTSSRWSAGTWHLTSAGEFVPNANLRGTKHFRFTVRFAGRVLNHGSFRVEYERAFSDRIWQGSDAFVNVCINSPRRLFSLHHRLYCWDYRYPATQAIEGLKQS